MSFSICLMNILPISLCFGHTDNEDLLYYYLSVVFIYQHHHTGYSTVSATSYISHYFNVYIV